jgi:protein-tyrosine phosphatase
VALSPPSSPPSLRTLTWDGCLNVRDLGGHATEDGEITRFGQIVRADSVRRLTDAGWEALLDYGVRTVVDLRYADELVADDPGAVDVDVIHFSLFGDPDAGRWAELDALGAAAGDDVGFTRVVYLEVLEEHRANVAHVVAAVGRAPEGGVVIHCHAGKDRTGLVTALLLRLVGVPRVDVAEDYAVSELNLASLNDVWVASAPDEAERARRRRISATPAEAMYGVLEELERRYGSIRGYLRAGGASDVDLDAVRSRLLGPWPETGK